MYDSRQLLQFLVDRRLGFNSDRNLGFNSDRNLLFNCDRNLLFDPERDIPFGKVSPVFRGQACPNCKNLINPLEEACRHCGGNVVPLLRVVPEKKATVHPEHWKRSKQRLAEQKPPKRRTAAQKVQVVDEGGKQICPNCSLKIPSDAVYCPRCRVKLDEWRKYISELRRWEQEQARVQQSQTFGNDRFYDVPSRRRR